MGHWDGVSNNEGGRITFDYGSVLFAMGVCGDVDLTLSRKKDKIA